jgi:hypothetical protein
MSSFASTETALCVYETALILRAKKEGYINDTNFIADTGASSHMVCSKKYLTNIQPMKSEVFVGSEQLVLCTEKGTYRGFLKSRFGKNIPICLQDVIYVPNLTVNLLSITKCISKHGVQFTATNSKLFQYNEGTQIEFDKELMLLILYHQMARPLI